jgi:arylsulfotransferase ASST
MRGSVARASLLALALAGAFGLGYLARDPGRRGVPDPPAAAAPARASLPAAEPAPRPASGRPRRPRAREAPWVPEGAPPGSWRLARGAASPAPPPAGTELSKLAALPYLQGYRKASRRPVVSRYDPARAYRGLNLYVSGHAAEAILADMEGRPLHRWRQDLRRLWPDLARDPRMARLEYWRRAHLDPDGGLLAIYEGLGLVKLDRRSRVLWSRRGGFHHDLQVTADGTIYALDREGRVIPEIDPARPVLEDYVTVLDPAGRTRRRVSVLRAFQRSLYAPLLRDLPRGGDVLHTNTVEVLDGRQARENPAFRRGNLLISVLTLDTVAVVDPDREQVVWALKGMWRRQHQPTLLDDGHLLLFDNLGAGRRSRVLEIDPLTQQLAWSYGGDRRTDLFSRGLGSCQRLPNGDTLITESENGRALEVARDGTVVWQFDSPHRAGRAGELVASLFEVVRLPPDFPFRGEAAPATGTGGVRGEPGGGVPGTGAAPR